MQIILVGLSLVLATTVARSLPLNITEVTSNSVFLGTRAADDEFPYMAFIGNGDYDPRTNGYCSAVLITPSHLLTHGKCEQADLGHSLTTYRWAYFGGAIKKRISKRIIIVFTQLDGEVDLSDSIQPIKIIPTNDQDLVQWSHMRTVSFGPMTLTDAGGILNSELSFPFDNKQCSEKFPVFSPDYSLCVAGQDLDPQLSEGDNGGALVALRSGCGKGCLVGLVGYEPLMEHSDGHIWPIVPYVYVRVSKFCGKIAGATGGKFRCTNVVD
ncbi:hypothetical protein QR680_015002 [Steinernema hermaphroditum]|uniref:Peptidase S1 domain-containing protein n=1 Tax=Steinernema hermaphroditum TaxID=289476 RepID=A0AA39M4Z7_9BILA|nr:hypothetical protein QR680_015002 [Steinernema hermaphroditum]